MLEQVMDMIILAKTFGFVKGDICTTKWHERGLPHAHILLWLLTKIHSNEIGRNTKSIDKDPYKIVKRKIVLGARGRGFNLNTSCLKSPNRFLTETNW